MTSAKPFEILLVEDDPGHAMLVQMNLESAGLSNPIIHKENGQDALDYIFDAMADHPHPLLILLDLNLPMVNGFQVLERVKSHLSTKHIPVIILTTTQTEEEIKKCYNLGCSVFLTKPVEYDMFQNAIRQLGLFLSIVHVPSESD